MSSSDMQFRFRVTVGSQQQRHSILHCSRPVYLGHKVLIKIIRMTLLYYFRFLLRCSCLQFHFIVWRSAELNVFGVEEMALANMQIKNLEVKTVYLNMGKYKITSNVKLWKLSIYLYLFIYLQVNTSALSDMIDPSERKVSEFPTVGEKWCQN